MEDQVLLSYHLSFLFSELANPIKSSMSALKTISLSLGLLGVL